MSEEQTQVTETPDTAPPAGQANVENKTMPSGSNDTPEHNPDANITVDLPDENKTGGFDETGLYAGKYQTIAEFENGHKELMQKYTEKNPEAPEEYQVDLSQSENEALRGFEVTNDDPLISALTPILQKHRVTQEAFNDMAETFYSVMAGVEVSTDDIVAELGDDGPQIVEELNQFVESSDSMKGFQNVAVELGRSVEGLNLLRYVSQLEAKVKTASSVPTDIGNTNVVRKSGQELEQEAINFKAGIANFDTNRAAQTRYDDMMDKAMQRYEDESAAAQ